MALSRPVKEDDLGQEPPSHTCPLMDPLASRCLAAERFEHNIFVAKPASSGDDGGGGGRDKLCIQIYQGSR